MAAFNNPKEWTCPDLSTVRHVKDNTQVLPMFDINE